MTHPVPGAQVDTFQYSCLLPKDSVPQSPASQFTVLYADSMNSSNTFSLLSCPDPKQYLVVIKVSMFRLQLLPASTVLFVVGWVHSCADDLVRTQALAGAVLTATDVSSTIATHCDLADGQSQCLLQLPYIGYDLPSGQTLRVDYTCICGKGNAPGVDPVTGACTPCTAGAPCT